MAAQFRIYPKDLDEGTADEAGYELAHTFGLYVDGEQVLRCAGVWDGSWWTQCREMGQDPRSHPLAGRTRRAMLEKLQMVRQTAIDPETAVVDLCG